MKIGILTVHLREAEGIKGDGTFGFGKADPYAETWLSDFLGYATSPVVSTVKQNAGSKPEWNEDLRLFVDYNARSILTIVLKDKDRFRSDDYLGVLKIDLNAIFEKNPHEVPLNWYAVYYQSRMKAVANGKAGPQQVRQRGNLHLSLSFEETQGQSPSMPYVAPSGLHKDRFNWGTIFEAGQLGIGVANLFGVGGGHVHAGGKCGTGGGSGGGGGGTCRGQGGGAHGGQGGGGAGK